MTLGNKKHRIKKLEEIKDVIVNFSSQELIQFRVWFVKETVRRERLHDQEDMQVFEDRRREPTISYEKFCRKLKTRH